MDSAQCTADGKTYYADQFKRLPDAEREAKRHHLICPECRAKAFYRKPSKSGQSACFGAFHNNGCDAGSEPHPRQGDPGEEELQAIRNDGHIELVADYRNDKPGTGEPGSGTKGGSAPRGHYGGTDQRTSHSRRRLKAILKLLAETDFRNSSQTLEFPDRGTRTVRKWFVQFSEIEEHHFGTFHGYWGLLTGGRFSKDGKLWLNTSNDFGSLSVVIYPGKTEAFLKRFGLSRDDIKVSDILSGAQLLVFGRLERAQTGKPGIKIAGLEWMALRDFDI